MGSCPYCESPTMDGDTICYSCGRVLASSRIMNERIGMQLDRHSGVNTYKMTTAPKRRGYVQTDRGRSKNILKGGRNRFRTLVMLGLVAFIMLSPQAREHILSEVGDLKEFLENPTLGYMVYDIDADYTLNRIVSATNGDNTPSSMLENLPISPDIKALEGEASTFVYTDGTNPSPNQLIQDVTEIKLIIDGQTINIPLEGIPPRMVADKITTANGHEVWWPGTSGNGDDFCIGGPCVKVRVNLGPSESTTYEYQTTIKTKSYTWDGDSGNILPTVPGFTSGITSETSGTFADFENRGDGVREDTFTDAKWFNKNRLDQYDYAIDGAAANVIAAVASVESNLPEGNDNVYDFVRGVFDYIRDNIQYDDDAPSPSRSGPSCLGAGIGDCDEQTNAFLSMLRVRGVPGWYVFGVLSSQSFTQWESHAWGYIQLPMSDEWCNEMNIDLNTCFVEASVDVTNNKWLLHTSSALIDWIEKPDPTGTYINAFYRPISHIHNSNGDGIDRDRTFDTVGAINYGGGKFPVYQ